MEHAYSLLEIKSVESARRLISGIASTPELDRQGDIFDPAGATFRNPVPLLLHHDDKHPIGTASLQVTAEGITFDALMPAIDEPGPLKSRIDDAWQCLKAGVISGASIGFRVLKGEPLRAGGRRITKSEICELSLVTIPANAAATIRLVKSLVAAGRPEKRLMTTAEQIQTLETKRASVVADMDAIMEDGAAELPTEKATEYDALALQVKSLDADITRRKEHEQLVIKAARPVLSQIRVVTPAVEPGILMARYCIAKLVAKLDGVDAVSYAEKRWGATNPVALELKAAVNAGTTTDAVWAKPLVNPSITSDFLPLLRAATIIGNITGLHTVPFNVKVPTQTGGAAVQWVGELKPKPVSAMAFSQASIDFAKVAAIVVLSQELVRFSNPSAEAVVRDSIVKDIAAFLDAQFTDPAVAAVVGVHPASITNGAATAVATSNPLADIVGLINSFAVANIPITGLHIVMSPANALSMAFRTNLDGSLQFPGVTMNGGDWKGIKILTSNVVGTNVIALQPNYILYADDGGVTIDASTEASLQMDSAPMSPVDATTVYASMFQMNAVAIRAERYSTWLRVGVNSVKYLTAASYPAPTGFEATKAK